MGRMGSTRKTLPLAWGVVAYISMVGARGRSRNWRSVSPTSLYLASDSAGRAQRTFDHLEGPHMYTLSYTRLVAEVLSLSETLRIMSSLSRNVASILARRVTLMPMTQLYPILPGTSNLKREP